MAFTDLQKAVIAFIQLIKTNPKAKDRCVLKNGLNV